MSDAYWDEQPFPGLDFIYQSQNVEEIDLEETLKLQNKYIQKFFKVDGDYIKYLLDKGVFSDIATTNLKNILRLISDCARELLELVLEEVLQGVLNEDLLFTITCACISIAIKLMGGYDYLEGDGYKVHKALRHFGKAVGEYVDRERLPLLEADILSRTGWQGCSVASLDKFYDNRFPNKYRERVEYDDLKEAELYSARLRREAKIAREERLRREEQEREERRIRKEQEREERRRREEQEQEEERRRKKERDERDEESRRRNAAEPKMDTEIDDIIRQGMENLRRREAFRERYGYVFYPVKTEDGYMLRTENGEYIETSLLGENDVSGITLYIDESIQRNRPLATKKDIGRFLFELGYSQSAKVFLSKDSNPIIITSVFDAIYGRR
jgi:hypothetical protein